MKSKNHKKSQYAQFRKSGRKKMRIYQTVFVGLAILLIGTWALRADTPDALYQQANNNYFEGN